MVWGIRLDLVHSIYAYLLIPTAQAHGLDNAMIVQWGLQALALHWHSSVTGILPCGSDAHRRPCQAQLPHCRLLSSHQHEHLQGMHTLTGP